MTLLLILIAVIVAVVIIERAPISDPLIKWILQAVCAVVAVWAAFRYLPGVL